MNALFRLTTLGCLSLFMAFAAAAEEGTEREEKDSCDPFGLPRENQQMLFDLRKADYLKAHPDAAYALGVETPVQKIFRDKLWFRGKFADSTRLSAARNEYEAFQLCVIPLGDQPVAGVRLVAGNLASDAGGKIAADNVRIWKVDYVRTQRPSYPVCHIGYWPDPLIEHEAPVDIDAARLQAFWVRVYVPEGTKPGQYKGAIEVSSAGQGKQQFTVNLQVRSFTLPKDSKLIFQAWYENTGHYMKYYKISREEAQDMMLRYAATLIKEYKLLPIDMMRNFYNKQDADFKRFDQLMQPFVDAGMRLSRMPFLKIEGIKGSFGLAPDEFKRLTDHLREKGWLDKAYVYGLHDEPAESAYPELREYAKAVKKLVPDVKILTSDSPNPGLAGYTDAWWSDVSTEDRDYNRERQKAGDLVLWYFCRIPVHMDHIYQSIWDAPLMLIDRAAVEQRVIFWLAWKYGIDGIMIYGGISGWYKKGDTTWPAEPWDPYSADYKSPYGGSDNGNGYLVYPGKDGPRPSVRLEVLREGREDYEYLWLLRELAGKTPGPDIQAMLSISPLIAVTPHEFTRDPAAFYAERERIAATIESLQPKK